MASRRPRRKLRGDTPRRDRTPRRGSFSKSEENQARRFLTPRLFAYLKSQYAPGEVRAVIQNLKKHVDGIRDLQKSRRRAYKRERTQKGYTFSPPKLTALPVRRGRGEKWVIFRGREAIYNGRAFSAEKARGLLKRETYRRFIERLSKATGLAKRETISLVAGAKRRAESEVRREKARLTRVIKSRRSSPETRNKARKKLRRLSLARARKRVNGMLESAIHEIVSPGPKPKPAPRGGLGDEGD